MIKNELNQKLQLTCIVCALLSGTNYLHANGKWLDRHEKEIIPTVKKLTEEGIHINGTVRDSHGRTTFWSEYCNKRTNDRYNNRYRWQLFFRSSKSKFYTSIHLHGFESRKLLLVTKST